jgi:hypothetical protein
MSAPGTRRLAGIRFVERSPALPEKLPRMDIAVFVGFASAGPLNRPIVVEDVPHFTSLFGHDLPLAWDVKKCEQLYAALGPAVRAFFRNGGRRCWIIRVAGDAETTVFVLPGLMRLHCGQLAPAYARARAVGSGFDALRAATALTVRSFEVLSVKLLDGDLAMLQVALSSHAALNSGDLLRLTLDDERTEAFFRVHSATPSSSSPPDAGSGRFDVAVQKCGSLCWIEAEDIMPGAFNVVWQRPFDPPTAAAATVALDVDSPPANRDILILLEVAWEFRPPPGTFLQLWSAGEKFWFQVFESQLGTTAASPPARGARIRGRAFAWTDEVPAFSPGWRPRGEKLTFELRVQPAEADPVRLIDLGFAPEHAKFWNALPTDEELFAGTDFLQSIAKAKASAYDALWSEALEPRFPLAGDGDRDAVFLPIGMRLLPEPFMPAQASSRSALERDGLENFSSSLFLDSRLLDSLSTTLLADADFILSQMPDSDPLSEGVRRINKGDYGVRVPVKARDERLIGIHAAFEVEEATLIAVPDATQRGWHRADSPEVPPPTVSKAREHPSWWHFLECNPPESPPADAHAPERGHFLQCALRVLDAPLLESSAPDLSGAFVLSWLSGDADAEFILEEATQPDFSDTTELWRGHGYSHTVLTRIPGYYYYRVRAEASEESSEWSNGVVVPIRVVGRWEVNAAGDFQEDTLREVHRFEDNTLRDVHRALLRFCAARGDIMAVFSLPAHFREDDALSYLQKLKIARDATFTSRVQPLGTDEERAFSYAAVYHPWLVVREESSQLITMPPDGAACGIIARRSLTRGAWIAPANEAFSGVVALTPRIAPDRYLELLLTQLDLIRQEPHGFLALNADTFSNDDDLRPINVRRLLILVRRAALRIGMTYVFEPNDPTLRRTVQGAFESIMQQLFMRGAFAGATPDTSYQVVTDDTLNTPRDVDVGRFRVDLKVAPALPMSFLTVRLVQIGERAIATEIL